MGRGSSRHSGARDSANPESRKLDCFVASLLAMTGKTVYSIGDILETDLCENVANRHCERSEAIHGAAR
jgi:hypothetical protein